MALAVSFFQRWRLGAVPQPGLRVHDQRRHGRDGRGEVAKGVREREGGEGLAQGSARGQTSVLNRFQGALSWNLYKLGPGAVPFRTTIERV